MSFSWISFIKRSSLLTIFALALAGCGSGDGPESLIDERYSGRLLDGPSAGVTFRTDSLTGTTNNSGEFFYYVGETIEFSIGGIILGTVQLGLPVTAGESVAVTPVELTAAADASDPRVVRILQLLQSLDADGDHTNGITISSATRAAAESVAIDFTDADFETNNPTFDLQALVNNLADPDDPMTEIVSPAVALQNFSQTIQAYGLAISIPGTFQLVWADEFNAATLDLENNWNIETGYGSNGWGNDEWQLYTGNSENLSIVFQDQADTSNGYLKISALCAAPGVDNADCQKRNDSITSAKINTKDKREFQYGKIQARIKVPTGKGAWPAFWSLGAGFPDTPWPAAGEIDFMEVFNTTNSETVDGLFTIHWEQTDGAGDRQYTSTSRSIDGSQFHVFEAEWNAERIIGRVDGVAYANYEINPATQSEFLNPFYLILNVAIGGNPLPELVPDATTVWPQEMLVDYVRVYQAVGDFNPNIIDIGFEGSSAFVCFEDGSGCGSPTGFAGGDASVQANPDTTGNASANAARFLKFNPGNGEAFGGTLIRLTDDAIDLDASTKIFTMNVYSNRAVPVLFELGDDAPPGVGVTQNHTGSGWEELTFDFTSLASSVTKFNQIVVIFDNGVIGDADGDPTNWTFYFDDIVLPALDEDTGTGTGSPVTDHGADTGGVLTEGTTAASVSVTSITNSIDFSGNNTIADASSTAVTPFEGNTVLSIEYQNSSSSYGGAVLNFDATAAVDLTGYDTLNFSIDTSGITNYADMTIQMEPPGAGAPGTNVQLSAYTPTVTSGNWSTYAIPFADFTATTFNAVSNLGFWNPRSGTGTAAPLAFGTLYVDDIYYSLEGGGTTGGGSLPFSDDFESGDLAGWTATLNGGAITADDTQAGGGSYSAHLVAGPGQAPAFSIEGLAAGSVAPGDTIVISWDMCGSFAGSGEVLFPALLSEPGGGAGAIRVFDTIATVPGTWTRYTRSFAADSGAGNVDAGVSVQFDVVCGGDSGCAADVFIDNVNITNGGGDPGSAASGASCISVGGSEPTSAPTAPTAVNTVSIFSDAYTDVAGVDTNPNWGQATVVTTENIASNNVLKLAGLNYQGIDFGGAQDVSGFDTVHIDFWTADATAVDFYLIGGGTETAYALPIQTASWQSVDIPLSAFNGVDLSQVIQFKFDAQTAGNSPTLFIDNLYFYTSAVATAPTTAPIAPTAGDAISIFSDAYTDVAGVDTNPNWGQATVVTTENIAGNDVLKLAGLNYQGIDFGGAQDVSGHNTVHIDFWTADATAVDFYLIGGGTETAYALPIQTASWQSVDIPLSVFSGVDLAQVIQFKFDAQTAGNSPTLFIDNLYFYTAVAPTAPTTAPAAPTAASAISIFSDAYTNVAGVDTNPNWGQATVVTTENIASNNVLKLAGLNYQGIDFGGAQDVSGFDTVHIDFWTADATAVDFYLIGGGTETAYALPIQTASWQSVDIPLSAFNGVDLSQVIQFKFDAQTAGNSPTLFIDNLYFYSASSGGDIAVNGGLESGLTGWEATPNGGTSALSTAQAHSGTNSARLRADVAANAGAASFPDIKLANVGVGQVTSGQALTVSFWTRTVEQTGAVPFFAQLFTEQSGGGASKTDFLIQPPTFLSTGDWTQHSYNVTLGADASAGVSLLFKADCGATPACVLDVFIDDVSITPTAQ